MMLWWQNFPFISILLSMLTAIISFAFGAKAAKRLSVGLVSIVFALSASTFIGVLTTGTEFVYKMGHFPAPWGNEIRAGVLEAFLAAFFSLILLLSLLGGMKHIFEDIEETKINLYFVMTDLLFGSILAMIYTNDIFTGYVFLEICTITTCGILMIRKLGRTTLAAVRYMIISLLGSGLFLIGITLMYDLTGHLLMPQMGEAFAVLAAEGSFSLPLLISVGLVSVGLAIKSGLFPFHFWMPDTYGYATPASSSILSGIVSKGYIILLIKVFYRVVGLEAVTDSHITDVLFVFGLCAIIVGSISAMRENDIFRMTAFSSAAQIGYIYVGISLGTAAGFTAAIFQILSHAATKPLLFISASMLSDASGGSKKFADLQGSAHRNRVAGIGFAVGALSMVGMPLLSGFVTKILIGTASIGSPLKMLPTLIVLAVSTVLNAVYFLRTVIRIYLPKKTDVPDVQSEQVEMKGFRSKRVYAAVVVVFIMLNLFLGLFSSIVTQIIDSGLGMFS